MSINVSKTFNSKAFFQISFIGEYYIDIYHETKQKKKYDHRIGKENFAGIETGSTILKENGVFRKTKIRHTEYLAIILKNITVLFHINDNELKPWKKIIAEGLKHSKYL